MTPELLKQSVNGLFEIDLLLKEIESRITATRGLLVGLNHTGRETIKILGDIADNTLDAAQALEKLNDVQRRINDAL